MADEPKTEDKSGNLPESVTKVLEDIRAKLDNQSPKIEAAPVPAAPSYVDQREELKKSLGYSEDQMHAHEQMILKNNAPVVESLGWSRLEKKADLDTFRKEIESELSLYPQERRTPEIMEKVYYFVKGKHADSKPTATAPAPASSGSRVAETRVTRGPGYSGADPGLPSGGKGEGGGEDLALNDQEKFVASKLGVTEKDYARAREVGRSVRELKIPDTRSSQSMADIELRRLKGN